jgi:Protein of unknown function (DUF3800)
VHVHIFFDESGDYAFPADRFDCYVQAAVICPESALPSATAFVQDRCAAWNLTELHAHQMSADQLQEVAEFLAAGSIELCAQLTDTVLTTPEVIQSCRLDQAAAYERSSANYLRQGGHDPDVVAKLEKQIKKAGLASQIPDGEFVQATLLVDGAVQAIQRALYAYGTQEWRDAFHEFRFTIDGKLSGKKSAGEKYLSTMIVDLIATPSRHRFTYNPQWRDDPVHPWVQRFCLDGNIQLDPIFEHGLQFAPSHEHAGLQLADIVAFVIRRAVVAPTEDIMRSYRLLSQRLADRKGHCLVVARFPASTRDRQALLRYQPLAMTGPRDELGGPER